jgi:hypothetical protein
MYHYQLPKSDKPLRGQTIHAVIFDDFAIFEDSSKMPYTIWTAYQDEGFSPNTETHSKLSDALSAVQKQMNGPLGTCAMYEIRDKDGKTLVDNKTLFSALRNF